jgi:hypothetical protein
VEVMTTLTFLCLTTLGWHSGLSREIEIWFGKLGERFYLIAEHARRAKQVRNIVETPAVRFHVAAPHHAGQTRILDPERDARLAKSLKTLFDKKYGLIVVIALTGPEGPAGPWALSADPVLCILLS